MMKVNYSIDGEDFSLYGVTVSSSQGLLGGLKPRKGLEVRWPDENGVQADLSAVYFEGRDIVLYCFLSADGPQAFIERMEAFTSLFYAPGEHSLEVGVGEKRLEYKVQLSDAIVVEKKFRAGKMTATFSLKLFEPEPSVPSKGEKENDPTVLP